MIDDVIGGVREFFQDEGVDEQVLMELKSTWESKLQATKAVEHKVEEVHPPPLKTAIQKPTPVATVPHGNFVLILTKEDKLNILKSFSTMKPLRSHVMTSQNS